MLQQAGENPLSQARRHHPLGTLLDGKGPQVGKVTALVAPATNILITNSLGARPSTQAPDFYSSSAACGVFRKLIAIRLEVFIKPIEIVRSASSFSENIADAA